MNRNSDRSIPWLRARKQRSGAVCYYLEVPTNDQRVEIALGCEVAPALKKRAEILFSRFSSSSEIFMSFELILDWYLTIVVPTLATAQRNENLKAIKRLTSFLRGPGSIVRDASKFEADYLKWRDSRLTLRARSEVSLFFKINRWHQEMLKGTNTTAHPMPESNVLAGPNG